MEYLCHYYRLKADYFSVSGLILAHFLVDRTKDALAIRVEHFNTNPIAKPHKRRFGGTLRNGFNHPNFSQTAVAYTAVADRFSRATVGVRV
jgi:hypothetical protein